MTVVNDSAPFRESLSCARAHGEFPKVTPIQSLGSLAGHRLETAPRTPTPAAGNAHHVQLTAPVTGLSWAVGGIATRCHPTFSRETALAARDWTRLRTWRARP